MASQLDGPELKLDKLLTSPCSGLNPFLTIPLVWLPVRSERLRETVAPQGSLNIAAEIESV